MTSLYSQRAIEAQRAADAYVCENGVSYVIDAEALEKAKVNERRAEITADRAQHLKRAPMKHRAQACYEQASDHFRHVAHQAEILAYGDYDEGLFDPKAYHLAEVDHSERAAQLHLRVARFHEGLSTTEDIEDALSELDELYDKRERREAARC